MDVRVFFVVLGMLEMLEVIVFDNEIFMVLTGKLGLLRVPVCMFEF